MVIAGPCSAETEEQVMCTPPSNAGRKGEDIPVPESETAYQTGWFRRCRRRRSGMAERGEERNRNVRFYRSSHLKACIRVPESRYRYSLGRRTHHCQPFRRRKLPMPLKGVDIPVLVEVPVNPDLELWIGALERISNAGLKRLAAIHRGFSSYDKKLYRNLPQWHIPIELRRRIPNLPIICDPSHIGSKRELIAPLCQQAMDLGFNGLIIESHCNPDCAWSDASQQVTPDVLDYILNLLVIRKETQTTENLSELRKR